MALVNSLALQLAGLVPGQHHTEAAAAAAAAAEAEVDTAAAAAAAAAAAMSDSCSGSSLGATRALRIDVDDAGRPTGLIR
jgi:type IV secretory pathway TrbL component